MQSKIAAVRMPWKLAAALLIGAAMVSAMMIVSVFPANAEGNPPVNENRLIHLDLATDNPRYASAGGHILISAFEPTADADSTSSLLNVHGLPEMHPGSNYGLYVSRPGERVRGHDFNPLFQGKHSQFDGLGLTTAWATEPITVQIYVEWDDGFEAPDIGGLLVLEGSIPAKE